jgi:hypothetical protein
MVDLSQNHDFPMGKPMVFPAGRTSKASKQAMELAEFLSQVVQAPTGEKDGKIWLNIQKAMENRMF